MSSTETLLRIATLIAFALVLTSCRVPDRYPPGGPYCFVLYADYSFRPARLLAKTRAEAVSIVASGRPVGVAMVNAEGLVERTRECYRARCSDWNVYEYDSKHALVRTRAEDATSRFDVERCPESPPQAMVKIPR